MCEKIKPFTTDGCSGGMSWLWKKIFKKPPPWEGCCVNHDKPYWKGGTRRKRHIADLRLKLCVKKKGYPKIAKAMYYAVRIGGHPYLPFPWRWGYGYSYGKPYENEDGLKAFKYVFTPISVCNDKKLAVRKRILHNGYFVLIKRDVIDGFYYEEIGHFNTLKEIEIFLYDDFNIEIKL